MYHDLMLLLLLLLLNDADGGAAYLGGLHEEGHGLGPLGHHLHTVHPTRGAHALAATHTTDKQHMSLEWFVQWAKAGRSTQRDEVKAAKRGAGPTLQSHFPPWDSVRVEPTASKKPPGIRRVSSSQIGPHTQHTTSLTIMQQDHVGGGGKPDWTDLPEGGRGHEGEGSGEQQQRAHQGHGADHP
jgi:hypothetical protein